LALALRRRSVDEGAPGPTAEEIAEWDLLAHPPVVACEVEEADGSNPELTLVNGTVCLPVLRLPPLEVPVTA